MAGASERYSFSLTTFSPSGKLVQIEYALAAVASGTPTIGIKATNGVVLASEKKHKSLLYDGTSVWKIESVNPYIGMCYSGMGPDYRLLLKIARKAAQSYQLQYGERIPTVQLVQRVAAAMQEYTQSGGVRPFGVSLLICGWDDDKPYLLQCDPSGAYFPWKATAMGKNFINGKTFLEKRYKDDIELEDAIHTAILALKESFEGQMTPENIELGIVTKDGFRRLTVHEVNLQTYFETEIYLYYLYIVTTVIFYMYMCNVEIVFNITFIKLICIKLFTFNVSFLITCKI